jgi:GNAT superfamily N-acetyltransferase
MNMYIVTRLSREQLASYAELTFPSLQEELLAESGRVRVVAAGASWFGKPVGLVWANYWPRHGYGRIRTMFVIGKYRRRGIGSAMLRELESALEQSGCREMSFEYRQDSDRSPMWERLFRKSGWEPAPNTYRTFILSTERFFEMDWVRSEVTCLPPGFSIFSWGELKEEERAVLKAGEGVWYPSALSPFYNPGKTNPKLSVGLRRGSEIVGWVTIQHYDDETAIGDRMYVRPPYQSQGRVIPAMTEAIRRVAEAGYPYLRFEVSGANTPMLRFVERRMKPCIVHAYETARVYRRMANPGI